MIQQQFIRLRSIGLIVPQSSGPNPCLPINLFIYFIHSFRSHDMSANHKNTLSTYLVHALDEEIESGTKLTKDSPFATKQYKPCATVGITNLCNETRRNNIKTNQLTLKLHFLHSRTFSIHR